MNLADEIVSARRSVDHFSDAFDRALCKKKQDLALTDEEIRRATWAKGYYPSRGWDVPHYSLHDWLAFECLICREAAKKSLHALTDARPPREVSPSRAMRSRSGAYMRSWRHDQ